jgi:3-methyl-2-oxobutanoate hydroxymethyltransferase
MGGFKVQGRTDEAAQMLTQDAKAVAAAGCFAVVLEGVPAHLGAQVTGLLDVPTIGIGAGPDTDGQVLVLHDVLGFNAWTPKFVRRYADLAAQATAAVAAYAEDVRSGAFPSDAEAYH